MFEDSLSPSGSFQMFTLPSFLIKTAGEAEVALCSLITTDLTSLHPFSVFPLKVISIS